MIHFKFRTVVDSPIEAVASGFNESLFRALTQGFPPIFVDRFDGVFLGAETHLRIGGAFGLKWVSRIEEYDRKADTFVFIDRGIRLPLWMQSWTHTHSLMRVKGSRTEITDDVQFSALPVWENLLALGFKADIKGRNKKYRKAFDRLSTK